MSAHGAIGAPEGSGHFLLRGISGIDEEDGRVSLGDGIARAVVVYRQAPDDHHPMLIFRPQSAAGVDPDGGGRRRGRQGQILLGSHDPRYTSALTKRDPPVLTKRG